MGRLSFRARTVLAGALALSASPCLAGRATNEMPVMVEVINSCTIVAIPLIFTLPTPINGNVDRTTTITVSCPPNTAYTIDIDNGLHVQGANRRVKHAALNDYMTYNLYRDNPRSQVWGKGNTRNLAGNSGAGGAFVYTVYGRLNSKASAAAGQYRDMLTVTVNY